MKRWLSCLAAMVVFAVCGVGSAAAQKEPRPGTVIVPPTSVERPQDIGRRAHTNFLIFVPAAKGGKQPGPAASSGPTGETPSSLSCVYQTGTTPAYGCPVNSTNYDNPAGGSKVIAIVDAYDYPTAASDFNTFSTTFGLPTTGCDGTPADSCLKVVYAAGSKPKANCGWAQEEALDIEWSHAMAPNAQIILVEAASNSNTNLMDAVQVASGLVANAGGGEVSMSWGSSEFSTEDTFDSYFTGAGVAYFASSGDSGGKVIWPSASPNVISAGGTTVNRGSNGNFTDETTWSSAGGGPSAYEPVPSYQSAIYSLSQILGNSRGTPDFSFDANPASGVSVYDSTSCQGLSGWLVFGGTSVAAPSLSGIVNLSGNFSGNNGVQNVLYQNYSSVSATGTSSPYTGDFFDVTSGSAGTYPAGYDWDFATGIGSDRGLTGMAGGTSSPGFSLSAPSSGLSVTQGSSGSSTITVTPSGGFTGNVSLSVTTSLPTGMTVGFSPNPVSITGTSSASSTMTVATTSSTPAGTYNLTVTGTSGSLSNSTSVAVTVNPSTSGGSFTISASPFSASQGSSGNTTVTVGALSGFTGTVNLSVSGLPPQSSGNFSSNPVTLTSTNTSVSSTLTVTTGRHTPTKTYTLTITGTSGSLTQSTTVLLTVQ